MERAPAVIVGRTQLGVRAGTVIADKYRVEREIGRGGFGVVVRAVHLALDRKVAIKILTVGEGGEVEWREDAERFRREGLATAALQSEHVVQILDVDILESGSPYMVMEYLEGETLHQTLFARGPLSIGEAVDHAVQMLAALAEAHAAGIVHRDLKPANVFLTSGASDTPMVKVLDFGVSKIGGASGGVSQPLTKTGAVIGTIAYMAPEQMLDAKRVDARADLWSVGIILYEMLTRQTPFGPANMPTLVTEILTRPPTALSALRPDAPPQLNAIIMRCIDKDPAKRYSSAAAVGAALAQLATPRARGALESLRRVGRPTGAAAARDKAGAARSDAGATRLKGIAIAVAIIGTFATAALVSLLVATLLTRPRKVERRAPGITVVGPGAALDAGARAPAP